MALAIFNKQPAAVAPLVRPQSGDVIYHTIVYFGEQSAAMLTRYRFKSFKTPAALSCRFHPQQTPTS